jgi:phospho-N-acetylmuramoyl-pentapeptide-transferase
MTSVLASGVIAILISVLAGPRFVNLLRRYNVGQRIRTEGPEGHQTKSGTPTMGGLLIIIATVVPYLIFSSYGARSLAVLGVMLGCGAIGFVDDYLSVIRKRSLGLKGRYKMLAQAGIALVVCLVATHEGISTRIFLPLVDIHVDLGFAWYVLVFLIIVGASNAVNLTDGLDGLAAGTSTIAMLAFTSMCVIGFQVGQRALAMPGIDDRLGGPGIFDLQRQTSETLDLAILAAALLGACVGFLWFNSYPAEVFMGDTGSLALGGALAGFAIFTKTELLLPLIGGIFVIEAASVIIQVISFRRFGKRVFLMAPIHHHFEMKAWSETKIMFRFLIIASIFASVAFVLYYVRFNQYA